MKTKFIFVVALAILMAFPGKTWSQKSKKKRQVIIETVDGTILTGKIKNQNNEFLILLSDNIGELKIYKENIKTIEFTRPSNQSPKSNKYQYRDNRSKYFVTSSAYNLKKGEGYYSNTWIFFNEVNYGLTDNFSIGGGIVPLFLFAGEASPVWFTTKLSFPVIKNRLAISGGLGAYTILGLSDDDDFTSALMANLTLTVGSPVNNASLSMYTIFNGYGATSPVFNLKGKFKISKRSFFMAETYFFISDDIFFDTVATGMLGIRTMFLGGINLDYGLIIPPEADEIFLFPYLGVQIAF